MSVTPAVQLHIHVPVWACAFALLILIGWVLWDVFGTQTVRDQVEQASDNADQALRATDDLREQMRRSVAFADNAAAPITEPIPAQPAPDPPPEFGEWPDGIEEFAEAITPQAIADDDWLAEQREWLDQQVADAKAALFAAYPAPTLRRET